MPLYEYTPLRPAPKEIRLLSLLPGQGFEGIEVEIIHHEYTSCPPYEAVSYVWGSPERTNTIIVREPSPTYPNAPRQPWLHDYNRQPYWPGTTSISETNLSITQNLS